MNIDEISKRVHDQKLYYCNNKELGALQDEQLNLLCDYNQTRPIQKDERSALLKKMFAEIGENCYIEPPFHANWGGKHIHFGNYVYANFNLTMVDDTHIYVGDNVMFAPNVTVCTATHPVNSDLRKNHVQYNLPVYIGNNVWIGAGSVILPGVKIGENTVIGAGSVVTKDIPANVVAVGNPCRVMREINDNDLKYYYRDLEIDL